MLIIFPWYTIKKEVVYMELEELEKNIEVLKAENEQLKETI